MEEKILKSEVFVNDTVFNESTEQPIDVDFTLPDFCPDISKIFKCRAVSRISSKGMNGKNITVDGYVAITVLYCGADGQLCSYEYQYPFSKNLQMGEECAGGNLSVRSKCEYINCRAVTGRKIDIHGAVGIFVRVFKRKATEIISDIDDCNIEQRRGTAPATVPMGYAEKYLMVEEEINIGQGQPAVERILRYDAKPCVRDSKIINDKIVVKGDMALWILYCPVGGGAPQSVKTVIPFSQLVDMEGVSENCGCETKSEVAFLEIKPRSLEGDIKCLSHSAKLMLTCEAFCENEVSVIFDAFSRKCETDIKFEKITFQSIFQNLSETFHCKKSIELDEPISAVSDLWCDMQSVNTKFENGNMIICGTLVACLLTICENGVPAYFEKPIDFEYKYALKRDIDSLCCSPEIDVASCGYTITAATTVELRVDLGINAAVYECTSLPLITDIQIDGTKPRASVSKCAMTIYFTAENECVWNIAKHYNASVNEIMKINDLSDEYLPENKMILIPAV